MIRYFFGLLLAAVSLYIASLYESTAIVLLGFIHVFLMLLSLVSLLYEKRSLQVTLDMLPAMADQREPIYIRLCAKHKHRGWYGRIKVQVAVSREEDGNETNPPAKHLGAFCSRVLCSHARCRWLQVKSGCRGAREQELSGFLAIADPGSYAVWLRQVKIYDMTGLFCMKYRRTLKGERALLAVLPRIYPMGIFLSEAVRSFAGDAEVYDSLRRGTDASETLKLRPFQNGDDMRNIHWKLSAKEGELVVRENSMPRGCPVAVLVETVGGVREPRLQCATSLSFCLMDQECPHYMAWYSSGLRDVVRVRVDDEESFYEALLYLLREGGAGRALDIQKLYREKYSGEPLLHWIRVGDGPSIQVDYQETLHLKASMLEKELGEMELLL